MIPVNDAITASVTGIALAALIVLLACRGFWHARVSDAYQDGHSAGVQTQIGRQQRALGRHAAGGQCALGRHLERLVPPPPGGTATGVIAAAGPGIPALPAGPALPAVIPFPEGLPPGLREFAAQQLAIAANGPR